MGARAPHLGPLVLLGASPQMACESSHELNFIEKDIVILVISHLKYIVWSLKDWKTYVFNISLKAVVDCWDRLERMYTLTVDKKSWKFLGKRKVNPPHYDSAPLCNTFFSYVLSGINQLFYHRSFLNFSMNKPQMVIVPLFRKFPLVV